MEIIMKMNYNKTITACFIGYIVQAIVNNFVPLLFLTFQSQYQIPLSKITMLVTFNFGLQLVVDLVSVSFVDKIGYRASMIIAHVCAALGLLLLPVLPEEHEIENDGLLMNFEPHDEEALKMIIPKYMTSLLHGALIESLASENGARMQAMDNATNNAQEMIDSLTLLYNRARQGSITQELTEIIAGAEAIS